jgi:cytochrome c oxidase assembly protein subunit 15
MLGRAVGVVFGVPLVYFVARGRIPPSLRGRMVALFSLGGAQGLIGAWMVQSGLDTDPQQRKEIRVSPYRLATHLGMAFATYGLLLWTALDVLHPPALRASASKVPAELLAKVGGVRGGAALTAGLVFTTALSGAFVAGNDAGRAFNTFPTMDGRWVPEGALALAPAWRNIFENTATVQFDHRVLALASTTSVAATLGLASRGAVWQALPVVARTSLVGMGAMVGVQVALGVTTLLMYVPLELAAAHQLGSLVLLSFSTAAAHTLAGVAFPAGRVVFAGAVALAAPAIALAATVETESSEFAK